MGPPEKGVKMGHSDDAKKTGNGKPEATVYT
jgi:hypothetical protein